MSLPIDAGLSLGELELIKKLQERNSPFLTKIEDVFENVRHCLNTRIPMVFPNYTMHDIGHSLRIIKYMGELVNSVNDLSDLEITMLVLAALLHDVGMAVGQKEIDLIKAEKLPEADIRYAAMLKYMGGNGVLALQEFVRRIHGKLSARYVLHEDVIQHCFTIPELPSLSFARELALICQSHTENYDYIKKHLLINDSKGEYHYNGQYIATILRLADILDIDSNRTPYNLFKLIAPKGDSEVEWKQHFVITNNKKIIVNDSTHQKKLLFQGTSPNASTHRKILIYIGWVQEELVNAMQQVSQMLPKYALFFDTTPEVKIQPQGYTFSDYKMTLQFKAISSLLMGEKIYGSRSLGLRELIQNSMDACRTRQENQDSVRKIGQDKFQPKIKVILHQEQNQVIIKDNGAGMSQEIIKNHFLNIGVSYYNSREFILRDLQYKPIGNFGIGFLSCFMLSNEVTVFTRHYLSNLKYKIELEKGSEYTSLTEEEDMEFEGTEVVLNYTQFMLAFGNQVAKVKEFLETHFLYQGIEFYLLETHPEKSVRLARPDKINAEENKGLLRIELDQYLHDIQGYAYIRPIDSFIHSFEEIDFASDDVYLYSRDHGIEAFDESIHLNIDDFVEERKLTYLSIPIVEDADEDDFLNGLKFTKGDVEEVIEKMKKTLRWITVLFPKEDQKSLSEEDVEEGSLIFDEFGFQQLVDLGHATSCPTRVFVKSVQLFEGFKNDLYLPFVRAKVRDLDFFYYYPTRQKELFIRNVLIKDFAFSIPTMASLFDIAVIEVDVLSRRIIPDISRNNVDSDTTTILNYAIGKAIHMGALENMSLNQQEQATLQGFITTFYGEKTDFDKM